MTDATEHAGAKAKVLETLQELFRLVFAAPFGSRSPAAEQRVKGYVDAQADAFLEVLIEVCATEAERRAQVWVDELTGALAELAEQLSVARAQADAAKELADGLRGEVTRLTERLEELEARRG